MRDQEYTVQSPYAPSPVGNEEELARLVFFPDHCDENQNLRPEGISRKDLQERGYSIYRTCIANSSSAQKQAINDVIAAYLTRDRSRKFCGVAEILCSSAREVCDPEGAQAFVVIDAAYTFDDVAHATVKFANKYPPSVQKKLREKLCRRFHEIVQKTAVIDGT